ncbi:MAG TPA: pilus assembly protein TadG-related protein, partial [Thermomicrobiaceae bacterium]|nr:pilus assembly protein TadG-related protein [Thermomicrobiaceae bacterium]
MKRRRSRQPRPLRETCFRQDGNFMVFTAIALVAMLGITSLVIDLGFTFGQRRFMQNGADAAALAAAQMLGNSVSPYSVNGPWPQNIPNFFGVTDGDVYQKALSIAQKNRNPGLTTRTTSFTVKVEYCVAIDNSHYLVDQPGCPSPNSWVLSQGATNPAARVPDGTYKVRVTVSSTLTTLFGGVVGKSTTSTSAQASAVILGVCPQTVATGNVFPYTLWDHQDFGTANANTLFQLWSSNPPAPRNADNSWKNILDFTPANKWCDGVSPDYPWAVDPTFAGMVPVGTSCAAGGGFTGTDNSWNRSQYTPDARGGCYVGNDQNPQDIATWASTGYQGTLAVGMKMPLYTQTGDQGNNIALAIYGKNGVPACSGTYFFNGVTATDPDHDSPSGSANDWGVYRDVLVFTYDLPAADNDFTTANLNTKVWGNGGNFNKQGRVTLMRILNVRIYSKYTTSNSE